LGKNLETAFREYLKTEGELLSTMVPSSIAEFKEWYQKGNGTKFDIRNIDSNVSAPDENGPLLTQRMSSAIGPVRDAPVIRLIESSMKKYPRF